MLCKVTIGLRIRKIRKTVPNPSVPPSSSPDPQVVSCRPRFHSKVKGESCLLRYHTLSWESASYRILRIFEKWFDVTDINCRMIWRRTRLDDNPSLISRAGALNRCFEADQHVGSLPGPVAGVELVVRDRELAYLVELRLLGRQQQALKLRTSTEQQSRSNEYSILENAMRRGQPIGFVLGRQHWYTHFWTFNL